jgi:hypothetical protein
MASFFKTFLNSDKTTTRSLLHESIPVTGSIASGTYASSANIKNYAHGMFQSVYDYPYLSSSANHIFDLTVGYHSSSSLSSSTQNATQRKNKINMYNQLAQILMGHDRNGSIERFDIDGNLVDAVGKMNEVIFVNFARLLTKDEVKKGSVTLELGVSGTYASPCLKRIKLTDTSGSNGYFVNGAIGQYGTLFCTNTAGSPLNGSDTDAMGGLIFYQAGIAAITASVFGSLLSSSCEMNSAGETIDAILTGSTVTSICDEFRHRIYNVQYNNTTELNSTIYFCRFNNNEFNYSSNPTYTSASRMVVKNDAIDMPVSYLTTVGLYSADNELLAVAKLSEPLRKDPATELTLRVRLDY